MASRPGLLTNPPLHDTSTILGPATLSGGKIQLVRPPPLSEYRLNPKSSVTKRHVMKMDGSILKKRFQLGVL